MENVPLEKFANKFISFFFLTTDPKFLLVTFITRKIVTV